MANIPNKKYPYIPWYFHPRFLTFFFVIACVAILFFSKNSKAQSAEQPLQKTTQELGQAAGELFGNILNNGAKFLKDKGPKAVEESQKWLTVLTKKVDPTREDITTSFYNLKDYYIYCNKSSGPYRANALCTGLRPDLPGYAPFTILFDKLAQNGGFKNGKPNMPLILTWRLVDALDLSQKEHLSTTVVIHAIYKNLSSCTGKAHNGCKALESQGEPFLTTLEDIVTYGENTFGTKGNNAAKANQTIKTAFGF